jgi:hypothetical protein
MARCWINSSAELSIEKQTAMLPRKSRELAPLAPEGAALVKVVAVGVGVAIVRVRLVEERHRVHPGGAHEDAAQVFGGLVDVLVRRRLPPD